VFAQQEGEALRASTMGEQLLEYLTDAHAIEEQSLGLLRRARRACERSDLRQIYDQQLDQADRHRRMLEEHLEAHGAMHSALKDAAMRLGALNWGLIFQATIDTPGKATAFAFALTHLKIASYELLGRAAARAGDEATVTMTAQVLAEERAEAARLSASFDSAVEAGRDTRSRVPRVLRDLRLPKREIAPSAPV
jgi:ferritin-like metal-binding protein YciE